MKSNAFTKETDFESGNEQKSARCICPQYPRRHAREGSLHVRARHLKM